MFNYIAYLMNNIGSLFVDQKIDLLQDIVDSITTFPIFSTETKIKSYQK